MGAVQQVLDRIGPMATLIERDNHLPPLTELLQEACLADRYLFSAQVQP